MINWLDIVIIVFIAGFFWRGYSTGLIKSVGSFAGVIIGVLIASRLYLKFYLLIDQFFGDLDNIGRLISFIVIFIVAGKIIYLIFAALDKTYDFIAIIPFLKSINHLAGAIVGLIIGIIVTSLILYITFKYFPLNSFFDKAFSASKIIPWLSLAANIFMPIIASSVNTLKSAI